MLYDETLDCWRSLAPLQTARWHFGLARLPDGRVIAIHGFTQRGATGTTEVTSAPLD